MNKMVKTFILFATLSTSTLIAGSNCGDNLFDVFSKDCTQKGKDIGFHNYYSPNQEVEELQYNTKIRHKDTLLDEQEQVKKILKNFRVLQKSMKSYEEVLLIEKTMHLFREKYLVTEKDTITIHKNLNQALSRKVK